MKQIQYELNVNIFKHFIFSIKILFLHLKNKVPAVRNEHNLHMASIKSKLDDDMEDSISRNLLEEHRLQLQTFNSIIESYVQASLPLNNSKAKHRLGAIKREIKRLESHLPIYARRQELLNIIRSNRILILKADTGSGKSTQLVQYLVDGGFAEEGKLEFETC
jgi:HrpA-like RNA helicase